jgi:hypothetical protein
MDAKSEVFFGSRLAMGPTYRIFSRKKFKHSLQNIFSRNIGALAHEELTSLGFHARNSLIGPTRPFGLLATLFATYTFVGLPLR